MTSFSKSTGSRVVIFRFEFNICRSESLKYEDVVNEIKGAERITMMVLQPAEKNYYTTLGIKISSETVPTKKITGRTARDDTTVVSFHFWRSNSSFFISFYSWLFLIFQEVAEKLTLSAAQKSLLRCDGKTLMAMSKTRFEAVEAL